MKKKTPKAPPLSAAATRSGRYNSDLHQLLTPIDSVKPDPNNSRERTADNLAAIKDSLQRFGQVTPIVTKRDGTIVKGNGNWLVAKELGWSHIARIFVGEKNEDKADEYALADNQTATLSKWNPDRLKAAITQIRARGTDPQVLGFNQKDLEALLAKARKPTAETNNWGDATPSKPRTKQGDLWQLGEHRLLVADSRDPKAVKRLMGGRKAQMVFTDPPYGVNYQDGKGRTIKNDKLAQDDLAKMLIPCFKNAFDLTTSDAAFYIWHASATRGDFEYAMKAAGLEEKQYIIWAKPQLVLGHADYHWSHEPCFYASKAGAKPVWYGTRSETTVWRIGTVGADAQAITLGNGLLLSDGKGGELYLGRKPSGKKARHLRLEPGKPLHIGDSQGQGTVWEVSREAQGNEYHPNQKPVDLAVKAMENSTQTGQAVLDLFAGSGSTLAAAETTGRHAFVVELEPKWADGILNRWERMTKRKAEKI